MTRQSHQIPFPFRLYSGFAFDNYLATYNREPHQYLRQLASRPRRTLVYLWGPPGSGKSHLLQALCREAQRDDVAAAYVPLDEVRALSPELLDGMESYRIVCLDAMDAVLGAGAWEAGIFHLFNRLQAEERALVVAGRANPRTLAAGLDDLKSRLLWGLSFHLHPLSDAGKVEMLQQRARERGFALSEDAAGYLLRHLRRDTVSLFDTLDRLDEASLAAQRRITIPFIRELLEHR